MPNMPLSDQPPVPLGLAHVGRRFSLVGAIVIAVGAVFAYAGGWLSPQTITPARIIDEFEHSNGLHPGFRRNHAKGVGVSGYFEANGQGSRLSKATVFRPGRCPVIGRFALGGGMPYGADSGVTVRSMALSFALPGGAEWRTGMNNTPVFAVATPQAFYELLVATEPDPKTGKPRPPSVQAFLASHAASARAFQAIKAEPPSTGFANSTFNSLNAFKFSDEEGHSTAVRWSMVPEQPLTPAAPESVSGEPNFLFDALIAQLTRAPLKWHLLLTVGQPGDVTNDATLAWPKNREHVDVGTLVLDHIEGEQTSSARTINFDPLILPDGIEASDDPLLSARSAAYSQSFTRRVGEPMSTSAVVVPQSHPGESHEDH